MLCLAAFFCTCIASQIPHLNVRRIIKTEEEARAVDIAERLSTVPVAAFDTLAAFLINVGSAAVLG